MDNINEKKNNEKRNVYKFKRNEKTLEEYAEDLLERNDVEGALAVYLQIEREFKYPSVLLRKIADLYTELGFYTQSINYWFKYMTQTSKKNYAECYNGLGGNYYLAGMNEVAAYYFNLQVTGDDDREFPFDDLMYEMFGKQMSDEPTDEALQPPLLKLFDINEVNDEEKFNSAVKLLNSDRDKAERLFSSFTPESAFYCRAQTMLAPFYLLKREYGKALLCLEEGVNDKECGSIVLNDLLAVTVLINDDEKSQKVFDLLLKKNAAEKEQLEKYFYLFFVLGEHEANYALSLKMAALFTHTPELYTYYGFAAFNYGKFTEAADWFFDYYSITDSYCARYYYLLAREGVSDLKADFSLVLPESECKNLIIKAEKLLCGPIGDIAKNENEVYDLFDASFATAHRELQALSCQLLSVINTSEAEGKLKDLLIRSDVSDNLKMAVLTMLADAGTIQSAPLVFDDAYVVIKFDKVEFSGEHGNLLREAYSIAFGRLAPYFLDSVSKLKTSAYDIYDRLIKNGNIEKAVNRGALAACIAINSGLIKGDKMHKSIHAYMSATEEEVTQMYNLIFKQ